MSGLLVAATIVTSLKLSTPSISFKSCANTLSPTLLLPLLDELKLTSNIFICITTSYANKFNELLASLSCDRIYFIKENNSW